jgi:hypothetical protein
MRCIKFVHATSAGIKLSHLVRGDSRERAAEMCELLPHFVGRSCSVECVDGDAALAKVVECWPALLSKRLDALERSFFVVVCTHE